MADHGLTHGPLADAVHLCVDMQNMFASKTDWHTPWMRRVLPEVVRIVEAKPAATIFTRFVPVSQPADGPGTWARFYETWRSMTADELAPDMIDLVPDLAAFVPPAAIVDKTVYSPWFRPELDGLLKAKGAGTVVVTGGETDVGVLATVLGAVDRGLRVVVVRDALCSSSDAAHDASLKLYLDRYGEQVEVATVDEVLAGWA